MFKMENVATENIRKSPWRPVPEKLHAIPPRGLETIKLEAADSWENTPLFRSQRIFDAASVTRYFTRWLDSRASTQLALAPLSCSLRIGKRKSCFSRCATTGKDASLVFSRRKIAYVRARSTPCAYAQAGLCEKGIQAL